MKRPRKGRPGAFNRFRRGLYGSGQPLPKAVWISGGMVLVFLVLAVAWSIRRQDALISWRQELEASAPGVSWPTWDPSWPELPRPRGVMAVDLRGPYAFAALNADRLRFIPCYCGCVREGHRSAAACFVRGFTPQGAPIWTDHAFTCPLCVNILREVSLMTSRGMAMPAIRAAIDEHHQSMFAGATRTPLPQ